MQLSERQKEYWRRNIKMTAILLAIWFVVTYVVGWYARELNAIGDLATGVAFRLHRAGIQVVITELAQPLAVRRAVSFSEAVYEGMHTVEGVRERRIEAKQLPAWERRMKFP